MAPNPSFLPAPASIRVGRASLSWTGTGRGGRPFGARQIFAGGGGIISAEGIGGNRDLPLAIQMTGPSSRATRRAERSTRQRRRPGPRPHAGPPVPRGRRDRLRRALQPLPPAALPLLPSTPPSLPRGRGRHPGGFHPGLAGHAPVRRRATLLSLAHRHRREHLHRHAAAPVVAHDAGRRRAHPADRPGGPRRRRAHDPRGRLRHRAPRPRAALGATPPGARAARGLGVVDPADRRPRGGGRARRRDPPVAGPPGAQARVHRPGRHRQPPRHRPGHGRVGRPPVLPAGDDRGCRRVSPQPRAPCSTDPGPPPPPCCWPSASSAAPC